MMIILLLFLQFLTNSILIQIHSLIQNPKTTKNIFLIAYFINVLSLFSASKIYKQSLTQATEAIISTEQNGT